MKTQLNAVAAPRDGEIALFRKMSHILSSHYNVSFVEEIHQRIITYHSPSIGANARRELGDLWIIAFSPKLQRAKMTFLQAKYHRGNLPTGGSFLGEYFQYELLSQRPALISSGRLNLSTDILSISCCSSVGSYGVFYHDRKGNIDLAYCSADLLSTTASLPSRYRQYHILLNFPLAASSVGSCNGCPSCSELNLTYNIDDFTDALLKLEIGADIEFRPDVMQQLRSVITQLAAKDVVIAELDAMLANNPDLPPNDAPPVNEQKDGEGGRGRMLIINVDPREEQPNKHKPV